MSDEEELVDDFDMPYLRTWVTPPDGWYWVGTHVDIPVDLEFSIAVGEDGLPLFERPIWTEGTDDSDG